MVAGIQLWELFAKYARRLLMKGQTGIATIPGKNRVDNMTRKIAEDFMKHNVPKNIIRTEDDVRIIHGKLMEIEQQQVVDKFSKMMKPKTPADVLDLTGKKIDTSKPILGGKNVPESEAQIKSKLEGMNKKTVDRIRRRRFEAAQKAEREKMAKDPEYIPEIIDPEDFAHGGRSGTGLNYLLGEDDQNSRVPFGAGGFNAARRAFLKAMGAGAAGIGAAKTGLFGLLKSSKPITGVVTSVPIKTGVDGMPLWFKPLVNKVIKEGDDVTKKFATQERQIVHKTELPDSKTDVLVTQDLNTGDVVVDIGAGKHGFSSGHLGQPVRLEYKASEWIETASKKGDVKPEGYHQKSKEEFWVEEAEFTGGHPENVKFEESSFNKFGEHGSDFSEVEKFATGTVKKTKKNIKSIPISKGILPDMASGGRVPLDVGGSVIDLDFDDMDPDEWLHLIKLARAGEFGAAEGGRVPMFLGGGLKAGKSFIRQLVKKLAKDRDHKGSYLLKTMNPKAYKKRIDDPDIVRKWHPDSGLLAIDRAKILMKDAPGTRADQLERYLDMAKASKESDKNIQALIDASMKMGMSREAAEKLAKGLREAIDVEDVIPRNVTDETILELEQMLKNLRTKGRKLNATGGRVPFSKGKGVMSLIDLITQKFGKGTAKRASDLPKGTKYENLEAIKAFEARNPTTKIWEDETKVRAAVDDIFPSGDYKMDAEMAAEALVENNPAAFGGKLIDDIDDATRSDIYGAVLRVVQKDLGKRLQLRKASKPTKTLEGIEKTGTIDISDPNVAEEFTRFMKETDPKGHRKIEEIVEITNFDPKGKKGHATGGRVSLSAGGLAGMLGE